MTRYLLDTNVISEVRKTRPHGAVVAWIRGLHEEQLFVSAVTLGELQAGVERTRSQDETKADEIERWLEQIAESYQVLSMDVLCFREWGKLRNSNPGHILEDAMIAATARVHGLVLATRNERDFKNLNVSVFNPFRNS